MKDIYPKKPQEIPIRIIRRNIEGGLLSSVATTDDLPLSEALSNYLLRLGYTSAQAAAVFVQLLTRGKVRVDFRAHIERLELANPNDRLTPLQAMNLFENYVASVTQGESGRDLDSGTTQRIIIQTPKNLT